ncbi:MAG: hypothetical protein JW931_06210 [Methanomicrobiaceae archaeon]|nr:hypothetical protein [Methanomicrobiaceae archaeon]
MLDFEAGQVYGMRGSQINIPTEIGVVLYDLEDDRVSYRQKMFVHDIDLVVRKNVIDENGVKKGTSVSLINQARECYNLEYNRRHRANNEDIRRGLSVSGEVHRSVRNYMKDLENEYEISSFWFFSDSMEKEIFKRAAYDISGYNLHDFQRIVKKECPTISSLPSLDKLSVAHNFKVEKHEIVSSNFSYSIPAKKRHLFKSHRALGDAARIFLLCREYFHDTKEFTERTVGHMKKCGDIRCKND